MASQTPRRAEIANWSEDLLFFRVDSCWPRTENNSVRPETGVVALAPVGCN